MTRRLTLSNAHSWSPQGPKTEFLHLWMFADLSCYRSLCASAALDLILLRKRLSVGFYETFCAKTVMCLLVNFPIARRTVNSQLAGGACHWRPLLSCMARLSRTVLSKAAGTEGFVFFFKDTASVFSFLNMSFVGYKTHTSNLFRCCITSKLDKLYIPLPHSRGWVTSDRASNKLCRALQDR